MRLGKVGLPDVFVEVSKRIEIYCLYPMGRVVSVGDHVPVEWFGYPSTCSVMDRNQDHLFAIIADNVFLGIWEKPVYPVFDNRTGDMIFDEDGEDADLVHDYFDWQKE